MKTRKKRILITVIAIGIVLILLAVYAPLYVTNYKANLAFWRFIPTRLPQGFTVTAHSGCEGTDPNTLSSLEAGFRSGAEIVEFDLHFDEDGNCVLSHDKPQKESTYTTLEEAFRFLADKTTLRANLDLKSTDNMPLVYRLIKKYDLESRVFFTGVNEERVDILRSQCPGISYYLNVSAKLTSKEDIESLLQTVENLGAVGINVHHSEITKKVVDACHKKGLLVSIFTADKPVTLSHVLLFSPDNITTRQPSQLKEIVSVRPNRLP